MTAFRKVDATLEPITLEEAKSQCRVTHDEEDDLINSYVVTARKFCEKRCRRAFIAQTWEKSFDCFSNVMELPYPILMSVESIKYIDDQGNEQTLEPTTYRVDTKGYYGRVFLGVNKSWPATQNITNAVTIRFIAGFGESPDDVPDEIKLAMKLLISHWYENREAQVVGTITSSLRFSVDDLLDHHKVYF